MKGLRMKLFASMSIIVLVLSMLIIGVWAVEEGKQIHLKGSVDFTISDNNLYIRDIRRRKAGSTEQGTTIDNFLPGIVESTSFILKLGPLEADSDFELVIDVVNTTETTYQVNTTYNVTNGTITASGKIEGDGVPLAQVTTADISGQIILNVEISVIGTVDIGEIEVPVDEYVPKIYDYFTFSKNSDGKSVTLTGYDKNLSDNTDIVIPSTVDLVDDVWQEGTTFTVTAIADGTSTDGVFYNSGITSVEFPSTLTSIGSYAFQYCSSLTGGLNLGECTSLTDIGIAAFSGCSSLTSITLPEGLTSIGSSAFYQCTRLTGELNLGECTSLTSIGRSVFFMSKLTGTVTIPASVTEIGDNPFARCNNLEGVAVESGNSSYYVEGNCLIEKSTKTLITGLKNSTIPSDIKIIGEEAFDCCYGLTGELNLGNCTSLTSIEYSAFSGCDSLTSITLPEGLTSIGRYVFYHCDSLTSITLPEGLTSIGVCAFSNCDRLTSITLPSSLTSIGDFAFSDCTRLASVTFENTEGWQVSKSSDMSGAISVDVSVPSTNATYFKSTYRDYYWQCNA